MSGPVSKANAPQCLAVEMKKAGQTRMALFLLLSVSTYSRPSELFRCTTRCLVRPSRGALNEWALLLAAQEYENPDQDRRLRPLGGAGLSVAPTLGSAFPGGSEAAVSDSAPVGLSVRRILGHVSASGAQPGPRSFSLSDQALGAQYRPGQRLAELVRCAKTRSLASLQKCGEIREAWPSLVELPQPSSPHPGVRRSLRAMCRGCALQSSAAAGRTLSHRRPGAYYLDLFAGQGGVSRGLRRRGYRSYEFDILHGPRYDLTSSEVQARILQAIRTEAVLGVMIALPCILFQVLGIALLPYAAGAFLGAFPLKSSLTLTEKKLRLAIVAHRQPSSSFVLVTRDPFLGSLRTRTPLSCGTCQSFSTSRRRPIHRYGSSTSARTVCPGANDSLPVWQCR